MNEADRYEMGMAVRRKVLGEAHVARAQQSLTDFNRDFQDLITRYSWGEIWSRPGLSPDRRSLVTVALMVALNRENDLRAHIRAALNNGLTREEIREVLFQTAIYCGVVAADDGFRIAAEVFEALESAAPAG